MIMKLIKNKKNNTIDYTATCQITGEEYTVTVPLDQYMAWQDGELIQFAMPNIPDSDREFLISHTSPKGQKIIYGNCPDCD